MESLMPHALLGFAIGFGVFVFLALALIARELVATRTAICRTLAENTLLVQSGPLQKALVEQTEELRAIHRLLHNRLLLQRLLQAPVLRTLAGTLFRQQRHRVLRDPGRRGGPQQQRRTIPAVV